MDPSKHHSHQEQMVRLTLDLPVSIVAWLDEVKLQLGCRSRGALVAQLLKEVSQEAVPDDDNPLQQGAA
jgi:hypothetical protein